MTPTGAPSQNVTLGAATSAPFPSGAGVSGSVALPAGSGSATITVGQSPPQGTVAVQGQSHSQAIGPNTAVAYVSFTATSNLTMNGIPGFTATLPLTAPTGNYFVAYWATSSASSASPAPQAPAWVSSTTAGQLGGPNLQVTVPASSTPTITLKSGQALYVAVYVGSYIPPINIFGCVGVQASRAYVGAPQLSHPVTPGDSYAYTGTLAQAISRTQPCPQPTATANANVAISVSVSSPSPSTLAETSVETDTYPTNTTQLTTVANVSTQTSGSTTMFFENGETSTDGNGNQVVTTYASPLQFAQTPEQQGNTWSGVLPATVNQTAADGTTLDRTYNPSTSVFYSETDTIPGGYGSNVIAANADGSGSYELGKGSPFDTIVSLGAPAGGTIAITVGTNTLTIPSWLPSPLKLYSDQTTDLGTVSALGAVCSASAVSGSPVYEHLQRQTAFVDPVLGYIETETVDSYDANAGSGWFGPVCATINDTLDQYYDWSLTSPGLFFSLNAQPVQVNTIAETLNLGAGYVANAHGRRAASQALRAQLSARLSGIRFIRERERAQTVRAAASALRALHGGQL